MKNLFSHLKNRGINIALGPILFCIISFLVPFEGMSETSKYTLGITSWMAAWWVSEVIAIKQRHYCL